MATPCAVDVCMTATKDICRKTAEMSKKKKLLRLYVPGDGRSGESDGETVTPHPPEKSALGDGWGAWGEGNTPCALAKGVSFPPEEQFSVNRP